jgi:hypothetical protein
MGRGEEAGSLYYNEEKDPDDIADDEGIFL